METEPTLEPELPICDAHHHLWEWKPTLPDKRYLADDLAADIRASGHNVRSTVYIEVGEKYLAAGPEVLRTVSEVEWVEGIVGKRENGQPNGNVDVAAAIIGHVDLCMGSQIEAAVDAMEAASPHRFRGIRHTVRHQSFPGIFNRVDRAGLLLEPNFRQGARVIARKGLTLEGCLYFMQIPELVDLLRRVPDLVFIANHFAGPLMVGPYATRTDEVYEEWRRNVAELGRCPNAVMKLGGVGTHFPRDVGVDWKQREIPVGSEEMADVIAPWVHHCIEHFGARRCMFESNFPGDKTCVSYRVLYNAFKRVSAQYSPGERADLFHDTATRIYGIVQ